MNIGRCTTKYVAPRTVDEDDDFDDAGGDFYSLLATVGGELQPSKINTSEMIV